MYASQFFGAQNCQQQSFETNYGFIEEEEEENSIRNRQKWNLEQTIVIIFDCVCSVKITLQYDQICMGTLLGWTE